MDAESCGIAPWAVGADSSRGILIQWWRDLASDISTAGFKSPAS